MPAVRTIPSVYLNYNAAGALFLASAGTNQNITLTPSGSGYSDLGSRFTVGGGAPANVAGYGAGAIGGSSGAVIDFVRSTATARTWRIGVGVEGGDEFSIYNQTATARAFRIEGNGRILLGTNVDSGALFQIGTNNTTSAGGMVFGTDTFLYRSAAGVINLDESSGVAKINLRNAGAVSGQLFLSSGNTFLTSVAASVILQSNNTTALTLDSSQNATFAGKIATAAPTGGAGVWKLGKYTAGAAAQVGKVRVEIDGVNYDLLTA